jgi:large subunit ribosomal protein L19
MIGNTDRIIPVDKGIDIMSDILTEIAPKANQNIPELRTGDVVSVHVKIKEGNRERVQEYKGTVLFTRGSGSNSSFTVRRVASNGIGVERTFLYSSPNIDKVVVERHQKVRRARLYYLRERTGKKARLKQKFS